MLTTTKNKMSITFEIDTFATPGARLPTRGSGDAAGLDLYAGLTSEIPARSRACIPTGLKVRLPKDTYGRIAPRSGLALRYGIDVGAGVVDEDYRGYIGVVLFNHSDTAWAFEAGSRIAQLIVTPYVKCVPTEGSVADPADGDVVEHNTRGAGGFGSTGV